MGKTDRSATTGTTKASKRGKDRKLEETGSEISDTIELAPPPTPPPMTRKATKKNVVIGAGKVAMVHKSAIAANAVPKTGLGTGIEAETSGLQHPSRPPSNHRSTALSPSSSTQTPGRNATRIHPSKRNLTRPVASAKSRSWDADDDHQLVLLYGAKASWEQISGVLQRSEADCEDRFQGLVETIRADAEAKRAAGPVSSTGVKTLAKSKPKKVAAAIAHKEYGGVDRDFGVEMRDVAKRDTRADEESEEPNVDEDDVDEDESERDDDKVTAKGAQNDDEDSDGNGPSTPRPGMRTRSMSAVAASKRTRSTVSKKRKQPPITTFDDAQASRDSYATDDEQPPPSISQIKARHHQRTYDAFRTPRPHKWRRQSGLGSSEDEDGSGGDGAEADQGKTTPHQAVKRLCFEERTPTSTVPDDEADTETLNTTTSNPLDLFLDNANSDPVLSSSPDPDTRDTTKHRGKSGSSPDTTSQSFRKNCGMDTTNTAQANDTPTIQSPQDPRNDASRRQAISEILADLQEAATAAQSRAEDARKQLEGAETEWEQVIRRAERLARNEDSLSVSEFARREWKKLREKRSWRSPGLTTGPYDFSVFNELADA